MVAATDSQQQSLPARLRFDLQDPIVCVGNALKETLAVGLSAKALAMGVRLSGGEISGMLCLSDGGDGFLEAYHQVHGGQEYRCLCHDPVGNLILADFIMLPSSNTAAIELAKVSGLALVPPERRSIMNSGTSGLGEVITHAVKLGAREIHIGLGGSATCDGGIGMLMRMEEELSGKNLGDRVYTANHHEMEVTPDIRLIRKMLEGVKLFVYCDVRNPLLGEKGTATVFAPQKGAAPDDVAKLEKYLTSWADRLESAIGESYRDKPGAGAAGGVGFALATIGGILCPGSSTFCEIIGLRDFLNVSGGLLTCEGRFDKSSISGKAPWVAANIAVSMGKKAAILCGSADDEAKAEAEAAGIAILEFGRDVPANRRSAESFTRLQERTRRFLTRGR